MLFAFLLDQFRKRKDTDTDKITLFVHVGCSVGIFEIVHFQNKDSNWLKPFIIAIIKALAIVQDTRLIV